MQIMRRSEEERAITTLGHTIGRAVGRDLDPGFYNVDEMVPTEDDWCALRYTIGYVDAAAGELFTSAYQVGILFAFARRSR